jgi:hypothetical protein
MQSGCFQNLPRPITLQGSKGSTAVDEQARQGRLHGTNTAACARLGWALILLPLLLLLASPGMMDQPHACRRPCMVCLRCSCLETTAKVQAVGLWHPRMTLVRAVVMHNASPKPWSRTI